MTQTRSRLHRALRPYLIRRRLIAGAVGLLYGFAAAGAIAAVIGLFAGRSLLAEPPVIVGLAVLSMLSALLRTAWPISLLDAALAIERSFPFVQDRVATAVDLLTRRSGRAPRRESLSARICAEAIAALEDLPIGRAASLRAARTPAIVAALGLGLGALTWATAPVEKPPAPERAVPQVTVETPEPEPPQPPRLFDLSVIVQPPAYSGLPRQVLSENLDGIRALAGSRVTLLASCDNSEAEASLTTDPGSTTALDTDSEGRLRHSFTLTRPLRWRFSAASEAGVVRSPWRSIEPIADAAPDVRITRPESDLTLAIAEPVEVAALAIDDFGITALGIRYRLADEDTWHSLPLEIVPGTTAASSARLNVGAVGLRPGGELILRAWATDNDTVTGPKTAVSAPVRIRLDEAAAPDTRPRPETPLEEAQHEEADALEELKRTAEELDRQIREALESAAHGEAAGEVREGEQHTPGLELQEAARRLQEQAGRLDQAMRRAQEQIEASEMLSPELVEKVRELHEMMRDLLDEEMRRALEELQKALESQDFDEMRMSLEQAREAQQRFMERLEQTLSMLRQARLQSMLEQLRRTAEELARRQKELTERSGAMPEGRTAEAREAEHQQRLLARDTEPLADRIEAGVDLAREVSGEMAAKLGAVADRLRRDDPAGQMRQAASALGRGSPSGATTPQEQAGRSLEQTAAALKELEAQLAADFTAEARRRLAEMLRDTLWLSHAQEAMGADVRRLQTLSRTDLLRDKRPIEPLRRQQTTLSRATEGLAQQMRELTRKTPVMDPRLARSTAEIAEQMAQAARDIQGGDVGNALTRGRQTIVALNRLAEKLMETSDELSRQSPQSALSQYMEQLRQLTERQQDLAQQTGEAGADRPEGETPGMSPSQLAYEQALIRKALEQMLERAGEATQPIADQLGGVPDEMEQVEDEMKSGRIERETVERQESIIDKMLEAQRSLYQREEERPERKAERPSAWEPPPSPPALSPSLLRTPKLEVRRGQETQRLPRGYEEMVRDYFRALGEGGDAP